MVNRANSKKVAGVQRKYQKEKELKGAALGKLENMRLEMRALEGRDYTSDLWKDKCKELFDICKDLQNENDELRININNQQYNAAN